MRGRRSFDLVAVTVVPVVLLVTVSTTCVGLLASSRPRPAVASSPSFFRLHSSPTQDDRVRSDYARATMKASQVVAGRSAIAVILAGMVGGVGCHAGTAAKTSGSSGSATSQAPAPPPGPAPAASAPKAECAACVEEDLRLAAHKDQVVVSARYLGLEGRWLDGRRTNRRCTRDAEVTGVVRFALVGENPWRGQFNARPSRTELAKMMEVDLPCPELSRPQYARLYQYDPEDSQRDGLGHAPVLRRGELYRLSFVRSTGMAMGEPSHPNDGRLVLTLVAVNPARP
jgi:hypothetical protein